MHSCYVNCATGGGYVLRTKYSLNALYDCLLKNQEVRQS